MRVTLALADLNRLCGRVVRAPAAIGLRDGVGLVLLQAEVVAQAVGLVDADVWSTRQSAMHDGANTPATGEEERTSGHVGGVEARAEVNFDGRDGRRQHRRHEQHAAQLAGASQKGAHCCGKK